MYMSNHWKVLRKAVKGCLSKIKLPVLVPELDFVARVGEVTGDIFTSYLCTPVWLHSENIHFDPFRNRSLVFLNSPSTNLLIAQVKKYGMSAIITNWITRWECGQCCSTTCLHEGFCCVRKTRYWFDFLPVLPTRFVLILERAFLWGQLCQNEVKCCTR